MRHRAIEGNKYYEELIQVEGAMASQAIGLKAFISILLTRIAILRWQPNISYKHVKLISS